MKYNQSSQKGFSLVEVLIVAVISTLVFGALLVSFKYSLELINHTRSKLSALSVANDRMEFFRSLPYDDVGVVSGFPAGTIPQNSTTTLNGIEFVERVRVDYVDDDADGLAGADANAIITDYKQLRLEYTWSIGNATSSIMLLSNIVPRSIETNVGGGTARINVLDADNTLLSGASVRLQSSSSTFSYDVTNITDASGASTFAVPADSGYSVEVTANISGNDYSTAQTYETTIANPTPVVTPFTVLEADISTLTFQIGELSDLDLTTYSSIIDNTYKEDFTDLLSVPASTDVTTVLGELVLEDTLGVYDSSGIVYLGPITPVSLTEWRAIRVARDVPVSTVQTVQLFTGAGAGPFTLISDVDLPGNAVGFTDNIVDISILEPLAYPTIYAGINLSTTDTSVTPSVDEASIFYRETKTTAANVDFDVRGNKIIGTDAGALPIYKYINSFTTDGSGEYPFIDLEFDDYVFTMTGGEDIASACSANPFAHQAGVNADLDLVLVGGAASTLRVAVVDAAGRELPGSSVNLTRTGYDVTVETDGCGQAFFTGGVGDNADYTIDVTAVGYVDESVTSFEVNADTITTIVLTE
jgi:prepilin-type N-terminal cleavage/methylation domain-containing protein